MQERRRTRPRWWPSLGTFLFLVGLVALAAALFAPQVNARRVARVEQRAQETAAVLLACAQELPQPLRYDAEEERRLLAAAHERLRDLGHPEASLPQPVRVEDASPGHRFAARHYCFLLAHTPVAEGELPGAASQRGVPALEVLAWPDSLASPGHTAFFHASDARPAYTRNLVAGWVGFADGPVAGAARPNADAKLDEGLGWYRSGNDERWIWIR